MTGLDLLQADAIGRDAKFVGRFIASLQRPGTASLLSSTTTFCMFPFMSLFVYESDARFRLQVPEVVAPLSSPTREIVARSRHSLKLFDDTKRGLPGQLAYFSAEIDPAHRRRFLRPIPWPWARDLGVYSYDGSAISTTHVATFVIGYEPRRLFGKTMSEEINSFSEEYGRYFALLGATLDPKAESFASNMNADQLAYRDYKSTRYYRALFNGGATPSLNALLNVFRVMANFAAHILTLDASLQSWQTVLKIRFLTLYHILTSLTTLLDTSSDVLTSSSLLHLGLILNTVDARFFMDRSIKPLRNTLMHYSVDERLPKGALSLEAPLYGLVQACVPGHDHVSMDAAISRQLDLTAEVLNQWAGT